MALPNTSELLKLGHFVRREIRKYRKRRECGEKKLKWETIYIRRRYIVEYRTTVG